MEFLPTASRTRPRLAVEVRSEEVVAARAEEAGQRLLTAAARAALPGAPVRPSLRAGNIVDSSVVSASIRTVLETMSGRGQDRSRYATLVVPDTVTRVLLLDFDEFPAKPAEALPMVRFRLKKLLPFEVDHAVVSYQIMSAARGAIRVLAVAIPCDVLAEYESVMTSAGYLPGAVLPSTLAALASVTDADTPALVVNAGPETVTTAIVHGDVLLLHRTVELGGDPVFGSVAVDRPMLPLIDRELSVGEWAQQEPLPEYPRSGLGSEPPHLPRFENLVVADVNRGIPVTAAREVAQAVSVAAAYFEDTLGTPPTTIWVCGSMGTERLREMLDGTGLESAPMRELVAPEMLSPNVTTTGPGAVPLGRLAGVRGALHG